MCSSSCCFPPLLILIPITLIYVLCWCQQSHANDRFGIRSPTFCSPLVFRISSFCFEEPTLLSICIQCINRLLCKGHSVPLTARKRHPGTRLRSSGRRRPPCVRASLCALLQVKVRHHPLQKGGRVVGFPSLCVELPSSPMQCSEK